MDLDVTASGIAELQRAVSSPEFQAAIGELNRQLAEALREAGSAMIGAALGVGYSRLSATLAAVEAERAWLAIRDTPSLNESHGYTVVATEDDPKEAARKRSRDDLAKKRREFRQRKGKL